MWTNQDQCYYWQPCCHGYRNWFCAIAVDLPTSSLVFVNWTHAYQDWLLHIGPIRSLVQMEASIPSEYKQLNFCPNMDNSNSVCAQFMELLGAFACSGLGVWNVVSDSQRCAWKARSYKPWTSTASKSEFDHANRILRLNKGVLVYRVSRLSRLTIINSSFYGRFMDPFLVVKQTTQLFCPQQIVERGHFWCVQNLCVF